MATLALLGTPQANAQMMPPDLFPGAPTGVLSVRIELSGSARSNLPNGVEWAKLIVARVLDLELTMLDPGDSRFPVVPVAGFDTTKDGGMQQLSPGMQAIAKAMEACDGDQSCQMAAMAKFGPQMMANPQAFSPPQGAENRFENWIADRRVSCAKGSLTVRDVGEGVNIAPPDPAAPYRFERNGKLDVPDQSDATIEAACSAAITVDRESNIVSLKLPASGFSVPVKLSGQSFTSEKAVSFVDGTDKIEILDQPVADDQEWSGQATIQNVGSVSHNSGQVVVPVTARVTWRFRRS